MLDFLVGVFFGFAAVVLIFIAIQLINYRIDNTNILVKGADSYKCLKCGEIFSAKNEPRFCPRCGKQVEEITWIDN